MKVDHLSEPTRNTHMPWLHISSKPTLISLTLISCDCNTGRFACEFLVHVVKFVGGMNSTYLRKKEKKRAR
jgi:hypothetical protein